MRKLIPLAFFVVLLTSCKKNKDEEAIPNNKAVSWTRTFGGSNYDFAKSVIQLANGNYIMAGTSRSSDGDIPGTRFGYDTWLAEIDTSGNKVWTSAFGTGADEFTDNLVATNDGGYLVVGHVGFNFDTTSNMGFIIKANSSGNEIWRKDFTTSTDSKILDIVSNNDGTYVAVGYSTNLTGGRDGWAVKIDNSGTQLWSKFYGGSKEDQIMSITQGTNGGFLLAGFSGSSDANENRGGLDGLLVKIASDGTMEWSKTYGGSDKDYLKSVVKATDGGYLAVGSTSSSNGDISKNRGSLDEWMLKVDGSGNKQWVKTYGGSNDEYVTAVVATPDNGFISIGYTNSFNFDVTRNSGDFGGWLIKIDADGNKTAASTYGDNYDDLVDDIITTKDGGYIIAGQTFNPAKQYDGWLVKIKGL